MARFGLMLLVAIVLIVSFQEAFALRCWSCNSTVVRNCDKTFDKDKIDKAWIVECRPGEDLCIKSTKNQITARSCGNKNYLQLPNCNRAEFCEPCNSDECNSAAQYGPAAIIVAIPIAIMKIISSF